MSKYSKAISLGLVFTVLSSCTCGVPLKVTSIQRSDKKLACKDIILEINEAEHYRDQAAKEKGIGFGESLMPVCWVSGYIDGEEGVKTANARIEYLGQIYDLLDCGGKQQPKISMPPPKPFVPPVSIPSKPKVPAPAADNKPLHYKLIDDGGPNQLHEHKDRFNRIYVHSHPHKGPHRHMEDE